MFQHCQYVGVDITAGPGVDVVSSGHEYKGETNSIDTAISCECFEHNPYWRETFENMTRIVKPGALVTFTCASIGRLEHGTARTNHAQSPGSEALGWTYYKNLSPRDFRQGVDLDSLFSHHQTYYQPSSCDLYFWGIKKGAPAQEPAPKTLRELDAEIRAVVLPFSAFTAAGRSKAWALLNAPKHLLKWLLPQAIFHPLFIAYYRRLDALIHRLKRAR